MSDIEIRIALTPAKIQMRYRTNVLEKQCKEIFQYKQHERKSHLSFQDLLPLNTRFYSEYFGLFKSC